MQCPRCRRISEEHARSCTCGFAFVVEDMQALPAWFAEIRRILQSAYIAAPTPWEQSGKGGTFEDWVRLRIPISECVTRSGTFLDIGCACVSLSASASLALAPFLILAALMAFYWNVC